MKIHTLFLLVLTVFAFSCTNDACDDVVCLNDGVCNDGICDCPPGFEGEQCEILTSDKISGNFAVSTDCEGGTAETTEWAIGRSATAVNEILINNFHEPALNIIATITDSKNLVIEEQFIGGAESFTISGTGTIINDGEITVEYTIFSDLTMQTASCSASAIRQ